MPGLVRAEQSLDLTNCDREPIHVPGRVQSHGILLVLGEPDLVIRHASSNCDALLKVSPDDLIGRPLAAIFDGELPGEIRNRLGRESIEANPSYVGNFAAKGCRDPFHALIHRFKGRLLLELEAADPKSDPSFHALYSLVRVATGRLKGASSVAELCQVTVEEIRRICSFDRVMVYQFDAKWNGLVISEDRAETAHSYLDLWFPASDIPKQARDLYLLNRLRLIADVAAAPAGLMPHADPESGDPIDLTYAALRSVSPIHIEYLKNMGVAASMSISIVKDGQLWGLVACHHSQPKMLPYEVRAALEHIGDIVALQLAAKEYADSAEYRMALQGVQTDLLAQMAAHENFVDGLVHSKDELLSLAGAQGCVISIDGMLHLIGTTPTTRQTEKLIGWLQERGVEDVFFTDALPAAFDGAKAFKTEASGILAISIPRFRNSYIIWCRPELVQTEKWAGNPNKPVDPADGSIVQLHPRKSFEIWKQTVSDSSAPWKPAEISAVHDLREAVVAIILRKAEELASVNLELRRSNKELEAFSYSVSHDLRAPFRHISGFSELLQKRVAANLDDTSRRYIATIMKSAKFAGTLVDSLLAFSQMSRTAIKFREVDMTALVRDMLSELQSEMAGRDIDFQVGLLPSVRGDFVMLKLAVGNLISNAIKYSRKQASTVIEIGSRDEDEEYVFWVRDNGVGFDMRFKDKLFGIFQRLHRIEEFEGTGIGLANVRRTIERHGGRTWADGELGVGATFYFSLPKQSKEPV